MKRLLAAWLIIAALSSGALAETIMLNGHAYDTTSFKGYGYTQIFPTPLLPDMLLEISKHLYTWKGAYDPAKTYSISDIVTYSGSAYISITGSAGIAPTNTYAWGLMVQGGSGGGSTTVNAVSCSVGSHVSGFDPTTGTFTCSTDATTGGGTDTNAVHLNAPGEITGLTAKTAPSDLDVMMSEDSTASFAKKKVSWSAMKTALASYFNGFYHGLTVSYSELTGKPTTVSGYGITDALTTTGNLSGISNAATARSNLGLGSAATLNKTSGTGSYTPAVSSATPTDGCATWASGALSSTGTACGAGGGGGPSLTTSSGYPSVSDTTAATPAYVLATVAPAVADKVVSAGTPHVYTVTTSGLTMPNGSTYYRCIDMAAAGLFVKGDHCYEVTQ